VTGVPIQLIRGIMGCWIAFSIWGIWGEQTSSEVASQPYAVHLRRTFYLIFGAMTIVLSLGWVLTDVLGTIYDNDVRGEADGNIDLLVQRLDGDTGMVDGMARVLAGTPAVAAAVLAHGQKNEAAEAALTLDGSVVGAQSGAVWDRSGKVIASFGLPPPRLATVADGPGHQFAFNSADSTPYYRASYPVRTGTGESAGVVVLEKSLDTYQAGALRFGRAYYLADEDGLVMATNRPTHLLAPLWPLQPDRAGALDGVFKRIGEEPMLNDRIMDASWANVGGQHVFISQRYAAHSQWSLVMVTSTSEVFATRVLGIVITLLTTLITLMYFFGNDRMVRDRVQVDKRLKLQELTRNLRYQATTDTLTGLYNRLKLDEVLTAEMLRAQRYGTPLSLILYDVDHFKSINDTLGHQAGDKVLIKLSQLSAASIRSSDLLVRWGGEEFIVLAPGADSQMAWQAAEKLRVTIGQSAFESAGSVTCSFGVAQYASGDSGESFLARADAALYCAKEGGRDRVELATKPSAAAQARKEVAGGLF
jgi:diguanylate cyclase (GGDEF)-like protein